jgi:hypothetical protein
MWRLPPTFGLAGEPMTGADALDRVIETIIVDCYGDVAFADVPPTPEWRGCTPPTATTLASSRTPQIRDPTGPGRTETPDSPRSHEPILGCLHLDLDLSSMTAIGYQPVTR